MTTTASETSEDLLNEYLHAAADIGREVDNVVRSVRGAESVEKVEDLVAELQAAEEAAAEVLKQIRKLRKAALKGVEL